MNLDSVNQQGLILLGCGKMGSAMLQGWLADGLDASAVYVLDPYPSDWLQGLKDIHINSDLPDHPAVCVIAVKPQMMGEALPKLLPIAKTDCVFLSIAAGTPIVSFEQILGQGARIVRAMPNTPAAIGRGISALIGNQQVSEANLRLCQTLLDAVGETIVLEDETQMDAVTAVSGSGPAYVFHLVETLAKAGQEQGLPKDMAMKLALATVSGAGALAQGASEDASQLRINVTSPGGTTQAALDVLMDQEKGFPNLLSKAVSAAADRSRELANG
jgi:pyrroline-5-carboxylate reductase